LHLLSFSAVFSFPKMHFAIYLFPSRTPYHEKQFIFISYGNYRDSTEFREVTRISNKFLGSHPVQAYVCITTRWTENNKTRTCFQPVLLYRSIVRSHIWTTYTLHDPLCDCHISSLLSNRSPCLFFIISLFWVVYYETSWKQREDQ